MRRGDRFRCTAHSHSENMLDRCSICLGVMVTYRCRAGLIHIYNGEKIPDGKYHVTNDRDPYPGIYVCIVDGERHYISKEEFENDIPTVDPPY